MSAPIRTPAGTPLSPWHARVEADLANDNGRDWLIGWFRVRETTPGRFVIERRTATRAPHQRQSAWHEIDRGRCLTEAGKRADRAMRRLARAHPSALVQVDVLVPPFALTSRSA